MNIRNWLLYGVLLGSTFAAQTAFAEYYGDNPVVAAAVAQYDAGDYAAALPGMRQGADDGDMEAQYSLAMMHKDGKGTVVSPDMAKYYFEKAGAQEHEDALFQLGYMYEYGQGVAADDATAFKYYQEAGWGGSPIGAYHAGYLMMNGRGADFDGYAAGDLFTRAAEGGMVEAQMTLAYLNQEGLIPDATKKSARYYYTQAEKNGHPLAAERLASPALMVSMPDAFDLLEAGKDEQAALVFQTLCDGGNNTACYEFGIMVLQGSGDAVEAMPSRAVEPLRKACAAKTEQGCHAHAMAVIYTGSDAGVSNLQTAAATFKARCDQADPDYGSCYNYAYMRYYTQFGMGDITASKDASSKACFSGGYAPACNIVVDITNSETRNYRAPRKKPGFLNKTLGTVFGTMAAMGAASSGSYNSGYRQNSSYSYTPNNSRDPYAEQSQRDFNQFVKKVSSYGSAYHVSCLSSNPYC